MPLICPLQRLNALLLSCFRFDTKETLWCPFLTKIKPMLLKHSTRLLDIYMTQILWIINVFYCLTPRAGVGGRYHKLRKHCLGFISIILSYFPDKVLAWNQLLQNVYSNLNFMTTDLVYKFRESVVNRYKNMSYNMNVMQQTACMIVNTLMGDNFPSLFNCMAGLRPNAGPFLNLFLIGWRLLPPVCCRTHRGPASGFTLL